MRIRKERLILRRIKVNQTYLFKGYVPLSENAKAFQRYLLKVSKEDGVQIVTKCTTAGLRIWRYE